MGLVFDVLKEKKKEKQDEELENKEGYVDVRKLSKQKKEAKKEEPPKDEKPIIFDLKSKKKKRKGFFIVFEGIDGAGGKTQSKKLYNYLIENEKEPEIIRYPDYDLDIGQLIHKFLHRGTDFPEDVQFLLYSADMIKDRTFIEDWLERGKIVIADRYFTSTIAHQGLEFLSQANIKKFASTFKIIEPDIVIYLKIKPETSIKRKVSEKLDLDKFESNEKLLRRVAASFMKLSKNNLFGKWVVVNGEKPKDEVFADILKKLANFK